MQKGRPKGSRIKCPLVDLQSLVETGEDFSLYVRDVLEFRGSLPGKDEQWKRSVTWPDFYASSEGRVFSTRSWRIVDGSPDSNGRLQIRNIRLHRIIADAFHDPMPDGLETRHLDCDYRNNRPDNLAYGTHAENMQDSIRAGTFGIQKLCALDVQEIRISGENSTVLGERYGVHHSTIRAIKCRKTWTDVV